MEGNGSTFLLGRVVGIPIRIHLTWLIGLALITWMLAANVLPASFPGWNAAQYWFTGLVAALGLFVSVLIHELGHSVVAISRGIPVTSITLWIFGGVSNLERDPRTARDEFLVAAVGPATSLAMGFAGGALLWLMPGGGTPVHAIVYYLAVINVALGVFNFLPGFPLDGGRVLRAAVWATTGNAERATVIAAGAGQAFAFAFMGFGVFQMVNGSAFSGVWLIAVGWFLNSAASSTRKSAGRVAAAQRVAGVTVEQVMERDYPTAQPGMPVATLVTEVFDRHPCHAVPVTSDGQMQGIITRNDIARARAGGGLFVPVWSIMTRAPLSVIQPQDTLVDALRLMAVRQVSQLPVMRGAVLVGMLSAEAATSRLRQMGAPLDNGTA